MANSQRNELEIKLGSNTYKLRPTFNAIVETEEALGRSMGELLLSYTRLKANDIKAIIQCGCRGAGQEVDEAKLEEDMMAAGLTAANESVSQYLSQAFRGVPMPSEKKE